MLNDNDIKKIGEVVDIKIKENNKTIIDDLRKKFVGDLVEVFVTKTDFEGFKDEYKQEFAKAFNPIDKKIGQEADEAQEQIMLKSKVDRHEKWIGQIAHKVDLKLES